MHQRHINIPGNVKEVQLRAIRLQLSLLHTHARIHTKTQSEKKIFSSRKGSEMSAGSSIKWEY